MLDTVPNDLAVTLGIITEEFQTPLSHVNVLSQTRKIPNMALRNAFNDPKLRALEGKWVKLTVGATGYTIEETTLAEADAWWEANKPKGVTIAPMDTSVTGLVDVKNVLDPALSLSDGLKKAVLAFGGKGTHYAAMSAKDLVPMPKPAGFIIPVYYYDQFLKQNGFDKEIDALLADTRVPRRSPHARPQAVGPAREDGGGAGRSGVRGDAEPEAERRVREPAASATAPARPPRIWTGSPGPVFTPARPVI